MAAKKRATKISGLKNDGSPNAHWINFKKRLDNYEQIPVSNWGAESFLAHIIRRYKDYYKQEYSLSHSGPPTKCKEMYCIGRMLIQLGSREAEFVKKYIDWVFDNIIIPQNMNIESIALFFTPSFVSKFRNDIRKQDKISRSTKLPDNYSVVLENLNLTDISTYGDLAFAKRVIDANPDNEEYGVYVRMFEDLSSVGFDISKLGGLN
jgi:hypothetical protein